MADRITANLPSRDFDATAAFYTQLGFAVGFRNAGWMILTRGDLVVEFFPHPDVDPLSSCFSACVRVDDPDTLYRDWSAVGISAERSAIPRLTGLFKLADAPRMFALVDPDGSLLRVLDNKDA
ncbi:bleomycin resistance protein [Pseudotabrizicola sp. 4114]|uniref:bleomycin resistance protein n=1 Tax=Pseudotabrizicola sp. 4114 TaxID=2817731 RepID=UPI00285B9A1E|nr:catechol 2,3-dioxygenase-like lactoylglutathione lyase family enzyme [Pseudorhodobacter sp. 4114]